MSKFSLKISCPSCSSKNTKYYSSLGNLNHLDLYVCFNCELIFKNKGSSLSLLNIEEGDYYLSKKNGSTIDQRHIKHFTRRSKDHLNYITNYFGKNQKKTVLDIGSGSGCIILTILKAHLSFWLNWSEYILLKRIKNSKKRPLAINSTTQEIKQLIKKRTKIYSKAQFKINCNNLSKNEIMREVIKIYELS